LDKYHIQGGDKTALRYGAFFNGSLVAVMTFLSSEDGYSLNRFATNTDFVITGIASRLLKSFVVEYKPPCIKTFADRRWTLDVNNNLYTKLGFALVEIQPPVFHYVSSDDNYSVRYNRQQFMKFKILKKFPELDPSKTGAELMVELGFDRIWDCGNFKFLLRL
jgi:hypothetical protein